LKRAGTCGTNTELLFLLSNLYAHILRGNEAGDTLVTFAEVCVRKNEENFRLVAVRDPPADTGLVGEPK
jgi:hypothetical protein